MTDYPLAIAIANKFHAGQMYGKNPYSFHLEAVAKSCAEENDDRLPVVAWLHDILEDTDCKEEFLRAIFDKDIVDAVVAISKKDGEPYEFYIDRVKANSLALRVKLHDSLCNLRESLLRSDMKRVRKYSKQIGLLA